jgi:cytoskeletal protein CcmA (bactofilin family)
MALFGDKKTRRRRFMESPELDLRDPATTVLAADVVLEGDLRTPGDAVVGGRIDGGLEVGGRLYLLKGAQVQGAVQAKDAKVEGVVEGPVSVSGKLEVGKSARITGDLTASKLSIAEGALVRGSLDSSTEPVHFTEKRKE